MLTYFFDVPMLAGVAAGSPRGRPAGGAQDAPKTAMHSFGPTRAFLPRRLKRHWRAQMRHSHSAKEGLG